MIRFALGALFGVILMSQLHEIKTSGLKPWANRVEQTHHTLRVVFKHVEGYHRPLHTK